MRFAKIVFLVAGIYGLLILAPIYFMENRSGGKRRPQSPIRNISTDFWERVWPGKCCFWCCRRIPCDTAR